MDWTLAAPKVRPFAEHSSAKAMNRPKAIGYCAITMLVDLYEDEDQYQVIAEFVRVLE